MDLPWGRRTGGACGGVVLGVGRDLTDDEERGTTFPSSGTGALATIAPRSHDVGPTHRIQSDVFAEASRTNRVSRAAMHRDVPRAIWTTGATGPTDGRWVEGRERVRSRRTLVVTSTFPQYAGDERGAFLRRHWELRVAAGEEVSVLAPETAWSDPTFCPLVPVQRFRYAPRRWSSLTGHFGILENIRERPQRALLVAPYLWSLRRALRRSLAGGRFDRVVAHFWLPGGLAVAQTCAGRVPFELYGHGTDVDLILSLPAPLRAVLARRWAQADRIYLPSTSKRAAVMRTLDWDHIADKVLVEHMGHTVRTESGDGPRAVEQSYVLFLGRLIDQKGVEVLLEAAAQLPALCVVVAGDGPMRGALERRAAQLGVDARFMGWVQGEIKQTLLRDAEAIVVPSRAVGQLGEGAPLVVAEAHAMGRPIVASDVGGIAELSASIGARPHLVPPGDSVALSRALERIC